MKLAAFPFVKTSELNVLRFGGKRPPQKTAPAGDSFESALPKVRFSFQQSALPQILNGREVPLNTTQHITNASPDSTSAETAQPLAAVQMFGDNDLNLIAQAAKAGHAEYSQTSFKQRAVILDNLARLLESHKPELSKLLALEVAKPIDKATAEVDRSIQLARNYAEKCREWSVKESERRDMGNGHGVYQTLRPLGPVLAYTPFNFPLNLVMHKLAPAMGAGASITIKPSPRCPLTALYLAKLCMAAGYKAISVVNLSNDQAKALVQNPAFKIFSFTGAPVVGYMLKNVSAAEKNILELGNNSALVIEDVKNKTLLKAAAERAAQFKFSFAGQTCIAVQRIFVNEKLYPDFLKYFEEAVDQIKLGNVLEPGVMMGPVVDKLAAERTQKWIEEALDNGAQILGKDQDRNRLIRPGWLKPTVLLNTTPDMKVNKEEVFAPVVTITPYKTYKEGLALANDSDFALHAGVYTQSRQKAEAARKLLEATGVNINEVPTYRDDRLPYGGARQSGFGAEGSDVGIEDYSRIVYMDENESFGK